MPDPTLNPSTPAPDPPSPAPDAPAPPAPDPVPTPGAPPPARKSPPHRAGATGRRRPVGGVPAPNPFPPHVGPKTWSRGHFKLDNILSDEHREPYLTLLQDPRTTIQSAWRWLKERGYDIGYNAVLSHRRHYTRDLSELRRAALAAEQFARTAEASGGLEAFGEAALARIGQVAMEFLFESARQSPQAGGDDVPALDPRTLGDLARTLSSALASRQKLHVLKKQRKEDLEAARREELHRRDPDAAQCEVVRRVQEILGLRRPDTAEPDTP